MRKRNKIILIIISMILLGTVLVLWLYIHNLDADNFISINEKYNCEKEKILYYTDDTGVNYYTSCLDKIYVKLKSGKIELNEALKNNKITFEEIYNNSIGTPISYDDGGSKIFEYNNFSILKCNKMPNINETWNTDVIIGNKNLDIEDGYCYNNFDDVSNIT